MNQIFYHSPQTQMLIESIQHKCLEQKVPIISEPTARYIQSLLLNETIQYYGEIGTAQGYSTLIAAEALRKQDTKIYTREISYPQYKSAGEHFNHYAHHGNAHIHSYYADATQCIRKRYINHKLDAVLLDAQKSKYQMILESLRPHIANNGLIIIDDVIKFKSKMIGLYHRLDKNDIQYKIHQLDSDDGILICRKSN